MPVSEEDLRRRINKVDAGSIIPQIFLTSTVSVGAFVYGTILGWGSPAKKHLHEMKVAHYEKEYAWTLTIAPLATAIAILPCAFFTKRLGPRKTQLLQMPFNVLCWYLLGFYSTMDIYNTARFFTGFFSATYFYCGEELLTQSIHRKYLKVAYSMFKTSQFIGVLVMNILGPITDKRWLCIFCGSMVMLNFFFLLWLPESPVYLMWNNPLKAKKALKWYRGNHPIRGELDVVTQYVNFLKSEKSGSIPMLKGKVVLKAVKICAVLFILKISSGYYAFIMDSPRWFPEELCCISPYIDNIIYITFVVILRFIFVLVHLYGPFGIRKTLLISTFTTAVLLVILGYYKFMLTNVLTHKKEYCVTLPTLLFYSAAYESGLSLCPEMALYDYLPFQIFDIVHRITLTIQCFMVFVVSRIYMVTITAFNNYITLWILALNMFLGYIFVMIFVIESTGKHLMQIQIELGGNPIGSRGSRRQRIASPLDRTDTDTTLRQLIRRHYVQQQQQQQNQP